MAFSVDKDLFASFAFYSAVLGGKVLLMSPLTSRQRVKNKVVANPEDLRGPAEGGELNVSNEGVDRVRRAHQNDIENVFPFFVLAPIYLTTEPSAFLTNNLFRVFTAARILHTIFYLNSVQPYRFLAWATGWGINGFMVCAIIKQYAK